MRNQTGAILVLLICSQTLACYHTPACDDPASVDQVKSEIDKDLATLSSSTQPIKVTAFVPTDKGMDPSSHVRLCTGIAATTIGAPTVTYTVARASDGRTITQITTIAPDQAMIEARSHLQAVQISRDDVVLTNLRALKAIATSMEEYAVDHNGKYPRNIQELTGENGMYLKSMPVVPISGGSYSLVVPASDANLGAYEIIDDGSIGAGSNMNTEGGVVCDPSSCRHVIYAQSEGLIGAP